MSAFRCFAISAAVALAVTAGVSQAPAQELVIDHLDGTATVVQVDDIDRAGTAEKVLPVQPIPDTLSYLNIAVDMADRRLVDTLEVIQGVTDPAFVDELLQMVAGTGRWDGIVASYFSDSYGAFVLESHYMGLYQSTLLMDHSGCNRELFETAAQEVWLQVQDDAADRDIDLTAFDGLIWWFPFLPTCHGGSFAYIGPTDHLFDHSYRLAFISFPAAFTVKHEIGHTLGLRHLDCYTEDGEYDMLCEAGNMGFPKPDQFVTPAGEPHRVHENDMCKTAANHQYALGWTRPDGANHAALALDSRRGRRLPPADPGPDTTFLEVERSGLYRISAHRGPAAENEHPELLIIAGREAYRYWFISFEEGDCFNPTQNVSFGIAEQMGKVTVRSQYQLPYHIDNSIREALLAAGECLTVEDGIEVCNEVLYGSEEADVSVKFPGWRIRHANPVRRIPTP